MSVFSVFWHECWHLAFKKIKNPNNPKPRAKAHAPYWANMRNVPWKLRLAFLNTIYSKNIWRGSGYTIDYLRLGDRKCICFWTFLDVSSPTSPTAVLPMRCDYSALLNPVLMKQFIFLFFLLSVSFLISPKRGHK